MKLSKNKIKKGLNILINDGPLELCKKMKTKTYEYIYSPVELLKEPNFKVGFIDVVLEKGVDEDIVSNSLKKINMYNFNILSLDENTKGTYINDYTFINVFRLRSYIYIYINKESLDEYVFNVKLTKDISNQINDILKTNEGLKLLSNYNQKDIVTVKTSTFLDYKGSNYYSGGAERYLLDLFDVCKNLNLNLVIYQHSEKPFFRKYNGISVIGLCPKDRKVKNSYQFADEQTKNYIFETYNKSILHIYSAFQECFPNHIGPSIGISHGISWDSPINKYEDGRDEFWESKCVYLESAYFCNRLISVDTNTPNWLQTIDYKLGNKKCQVIPNYVDNNEFSPRKDYLKTRDKIVILYPRRLYEPRGLYITLDIVDEILKNYKNVEFQFVGKGFSEDLNKIKQKQDKWGSRIKCYSKPPEEMCNVYKQADISLIPTLFSEGTSLSCLEALSSGNVVIATRIGGLTDLIINEFNGYLIEPSSKCLKEKLMEVLDNYSVQGEIKKNAVASAKAFNKSRWQRSWEKVIKSFDINVTSNNNQLIEIYIYKIDNLRREIRELIKDELKKGNLIYLRVKEFPEEDNISCGLLQLIEYNEEIMNVANKVYKDKTIKDKITRKEKIIEI